MNFDSSVSGAADAPLLPNKGLPPLLLGSLLETMPWGVLYLAPDGCIVWLNAEAEALWGVPAAVVAGHRPDTVQPAVLPPALVQALQLLSAAPADYWLPLTQQWISLRTAPAPEGHWWAFWDNVTARKEAEAAQQRSRKLLLAVEDVAHSGSYEADLATMGFYFSDGMYRLFDESPSSFVPSLASIDARSHPDDAAKIQRILDQAIATRQPYTYRRRIYWPSGEEHILEAHGTVVCSETGEAIKLQGLVQDVTARVHAEQQVLTLEQELARQATDKYLTLFNTIDEAVALCEILADEHGNPIDYRLLELNPTFEQVMGVVAGDARGRTAREVLPAFEPWWVEAYAQVAFGGETIRFESRLAKPEEWFEVCVAPWPSAPGRFMLIYNNISARKRVEQELRRSEAQFRTVANLVPDLLWCNEAQGGPDWYNQRWLDYTGQTLAEVGSSDWQSRVHPQDQAALRRELHTAGLVSQPLRQEYRIRSATGEYRWFLVQTQAVYGVDGQIATWYRAATDIHDRKITEARLQASEAEFRTLINAAPALVWIGAPTGEITYFNHRWYEYTGQSNTEAIGYGWTEATHAEDWEQLAPSWEHSQRTGQVYEGEVRYRRHDGQYRWHTFRALPRLGIDGQIAAWYGLSFDVHEAKLVEQAVHEQTLLRMRLEQQQQLFNAVLEAQETERYRIAEGLHNGVGQLLYATKLQLEQLPLQKTDAATRAYELLTDAIRQTRAVSHELVPLVLHEFGLEAALRDICRKLSSRKLRFEYHIDLQELRQPLPKPLQIALYRIAQELAQNIVKHAGASEASLALEAVPGFVLLRVEDNGVGFPTPQLATSGLGLRSIRDRVDLLNGRFETGSSPSIGTFVRIRLPLPPST
ncbi:PAS domain S-box protein [Hymenobacter sediminis]|uniref:PAS domain-containing sensor histidine kinase n=1 Tax=Hymenobacter sediminis TaxID=2218621 RepID=UPI000DA66864|nr:PAS domain S-box protein [Hymenobacter sediminis]RPD49587.1 PAS domain S-box protein [Hymenobacter sediminis]